MRDLFQQDDGGRDTPPSRSSGGWVAEKLKAEGEKTPAEGWRWIEVNVDCPFGHTHGLRELEGTRTGLTAEEQATIEALNAEYAKLAKLEVEYENADEVDARLAKTKPLLPPSKIARRATIPRRSPVPACSSASIQMAVSPSIAATSAGRRGASFSKDAEVETENGSDAGEPSAPAVQRAGSSHSEAIPKRGRYRRAATGSPPQRLTDIARSRCGTPWRPTRISR
jgi:ParB family chromosome partitioning protein